MLLTDDNKLTLFVHHSNIARPEPPYTILICRKVFFRFLGHFVVSMSDCVTADDNLTTWSWFIMWRVIALGPRLQFECCTKRFVLLVNRYINMKALRALPVCFFSLTG